MKNFKLPTTICFLFIVSLISIFFIWEFNTTNATKLDEVKLKDELNNNSIAIMLEKEDKTGYEETNDNSFPTYAYMFNSKLSGCIDNNGNEIENALTFNYTNNTVKIKTIGSTFCYMYFDYLFDGEGTESEPYLIQNIEDLVELSNAVNEGNPYSNYYFSLTRTLDFEDTTSYIDSTTKIYGDINDNGTVEELLTELTTGSGFTPIGLTFENENPTLYFSGNFDGNKKKVENIYIDNSEEDMSIGLFGVIKDASISNLGITGNLNTKVYSNIGGFVGNGWNSNIINCYNEANVSSEASTYSVGGLAGYFDGVISNSYNSGTVSDGNNTGGLLGVSGITSIINSYNEGILNKTINGSSLGGLAGRSEDSSSSLTILNSYNNGAINYNVHDTATNNIGGLIGRIEGILNIENSYNLSNINLDACTDYINSVNLGGIIGYARNSAKIIIQNSYNKGNISNGNRTSGIIGALYKGSTVTLNKVINYGNIYTNVTSSTMLIPIGGFIGYSLNNTTAYILNSSNMGDVSGTDRTSGFIGLQNTNTHSVIINSYNLNLINGNESCGLLISAYDDAGTNEINSTILNNVYNLGSIIGNKLARGIGFIGGNTYTLNNIYNINLISGTNLADDPTINMSDADMKSETFVNTLNNNLANINLSEIDESLSEYTLSTWKLGSKGYPVFSYQE